MIRLPTTEAQVLAALVGAELRAGGTDLMERRAQGVSRGPLVDLQRAGRPTGLSFVGPGLQIEAATTLAALAADPRVRAGYPGLAAAAGGLATPQIRERATLGGSLAQRVRCWYYRNPSFTCLKKGGDLCLARAGDHLFHVVIDQGPCAAPHPSTVGMALLAYGATVDVQSAKGSRVLSMSELFGKGADPTRENTLQDGELIRAVSLPPPLTGERAAYFRAIHRARAEWPLVEVISRLVLTANKVSFARVAVGGVANTPLELPAVEAALLGQGADGFAAAAARAAEGASPLPMTAYKVELLRASVLEALERAAAAVPVGGA